MNDSGYPFGSHNAGRGEKERKGSAVVNDGVKFAVCTLIISI